MKYTGSVVSSHAAASVKKIPLSMDRKRTDGSRSLQNQSTGAKPENARFGLKKAKNPRVND